MSIAERLAAIRARVEAATRGPWVNDGIDVFEDGGEWHFVVESNENAALALIPTGFYAGVPARENQQANQDATFIAAARTDVPLLLAVAEACATFIHQIDYVKTPGDSQPMRDALSALAKGSA